ncbi:MAG: N-formylglutamate amidohydrolase [Planctomycetes bacterium]|jgi:N-formylglutamate amidohydrolase|nr:N-formylglutamate amidohydrolase [Planctomycetota bacterium]
MEKTRPTSRAILHIPHASRVIPERVRADMCIDRHRLEWQLDLITDHATDALFQSSYARRVVAPLSRLAVDCERYIDDECEPMSQHGMGFIYTNGPCGERLRDSVSPDIREYLLAAYNQHHAHLAKQTLDCLSEHRCALIVDCHSFPQDPFPYEDPALARPQICLGFDDYHSSEALRADVLMSFRSMGFDVAMNEPFAGSIMPSTFVGNTEVQTLMIEVRRDLYWDEHEQTPKADFRKLRQCLTALIDELAGQLPALLPR